MMLVFLQLRSRVFAALFFLLSFILPQAIHLDVCSSMILTNMGHPSFLVAMSAVVIFQVVLCTPADAASRHIKLHAWLQSPAWIESDVPKKLHQRPFKGEPCFCFETALKLFYYCNLIYAIEEDPESKYTLGVALGLYQLTQHRVLKQKKYDAKCLLTWDAQKKIIVISFRGTVSMANVLADLELWRAVHPPERGNYLLGTQAMVHRGFLLTWQTSGLKDDVLNLMNEIMGADSSGEPWRVLTTGHSLGGALAHLASYDIVKQKGSRVKLTCITFGAPRPGNRAFAYTFNAVVPDAWDVFHADDAVSNGGKFIFMYKRAAKTVIVSRRGDLIVRPTYAEATVRRSFLASSVSEHFLAKYAQSLAAVLRSEMKQSRKKSSATSAFFAKDERDDEESPAAPHSLQELISCKYIKAMLMTTMAVRAESLKLLSGRRPGTLYLLKKKGLSTMTITGEGHEEQNLDAVDGFDNMT